ncbi:MAG: hypothetical protein J7494_03775 [Sphingobium sp.]|nr:hypothetical protein [Sphingobium sp.]
MGKCVHRGLGLALAALILLPSVPVNANSFTPMSDTGRRAPDKPNSQRSQPNMPVTRETPRERWNYWFQHCVNGDKRECFRAPSPAPKGDIKAPAAN